MILRQLGQEEQKERIEHRDALLAIRQIAVTSHGRSFFKYLFKAFEVGNLPQAGLERDLLLETMGFMRAGNSIFKLVAEANPEVAGALLAELEKERYAEIYSENQNV